MPAKDPATTRPSTQPRRLRLGRSGHGMSPHVTIALPAEVLDGLRQSAATSGSTLSAHIRQILYRGLDRSVGPGITRGEGST